MSDPQQPGATGDQIPPIPPAPGADVPPVPPAPPAAPEAPAAPVAPEAPAAPEGASVPPAPEVPPAPPVPPVTEAAPAAPANPYAQPAQNPYAAQPGQPQGQNPYAAPQQPNPYAAQPQQPNPYAAPGAAPAYAGAPAAPSRLNVMGLISLIAGGVAFLFGVTAGWIPYVGFAFVFIALVGLALGIVGLLAKNKGKGLAIAGTIVSGIALLLTAIISIFMLVVVSSIQQSFDDFGPDDPVITDPDGGETQSDDDPNALGSANNPASPGDTITFTDFEGNDEWQVVVGTPVLDATADVLAAAEYNSEPEPGNQYVVIPVTYTYVGSDSGSPFLILTQVAGGDAALYDSSYAEYPNSIYDAPELSNGGTAEVNLVFEVPTNAVAGSQLKLNSIFGNDIFVALD